MGRLRECRSKSIFFHFIILFYFIFKEIGGEIDPGQVKLSHQPCPGVLSFSFLREEESEPWGRAFCPITTQRPQ